MFFSIADAVIIWTFSCSVFLFCAEGLSYMLHDVVYAGSHRGYQMCQGAPSIFHLLFANDSIIFCEANNTKAQTMRNILDAYEVASRRKINFAKSIVLFHKGTS